MSEQGFENATAVQSQTIPLILKGKDIFAQAKTGSGKTGSFAIPILEQILRKQERSPYIILSPTRELAQQTHKVFSDFGNPLGIQSVCLIGGESFDKQKEELEVGPKILVATPGRFCDLIKQKLVQIETCGCVVFDEADRLFEMGFQKDIEFVLKNVQKDRQLIMVSATSNMEVMSTAYKFHSDPTEIRLNVDSLLVDEINHQVAMISQEEKMPYLVELLRKHQDTYAIIFCNTQFQTHLVAEWLSQMEFKVKPISGRLNQNKRTRLMEEFRSKKITILACTDVAARGLDIEDVNLVINFDLPNEAANYVHRIGRTGRAGKSGLAISFCAFEDCENLDAIQAYIKGKIPKAEIKEEDFAQNIAKKPYLDGKTLKVEERKPREKQQKREKKSQDTKTGEKRIQQKIKESPKKTISRDYEKTKQQVGEQQMKPTALKTFEYTSTSPEAAALMAQKYFGLDNTQLLESKVLEKGAKKFFFFGPRKIKFQFHVKPIYKRLLTPFLIEVTKKMGLSIYVRVSYKEPEVRVSFSGKDGGLFVRNRFELLKSFEEISKKYLAQKIMLSRETRFQFRVEKEQSNDKSDKDLIQLAKEAKERVKTENKAIILDSLNPAQRRIIHQFIEEDPGFKSVSVGEGRFKKVEISLK